MRGILEFAPKTFHDNWWGDLVNNATVIKCLSLSQIIRDATVWDSEKVFFDFLSLDVEGMFEIFYFRRFYDSFCKNSRSDLILKEVNMKC